MTRFRGIASACVVACAVQFAACDDGGDDGSTIVTDAQAGASGTGGGGAVGGSGGTGGSGITLDGSGGSGGSGDGASCGDFGNNDACTACLDQNCCRETAACAASTACSALVECASQCPEPTNGNTECVRTCAMNNQDGITTYNGALLCMGTDCSDVCSYL